MDTVKEYEETFFHPNAKIASNYLKKIATFDKNTKNFYLNKEHVA